MAVGKKALGGGQHEDAVVDKTPFAPVQDKTAAFGIVGRNIFRPRCSSGHT
jgi:hypothetical protein